MTKQSVRIITYLVLFMVFIVPNGLIFGSFSSIHHSAFAVFLCFLYAICGRVKKKTLFFWALIILVSAYTGRYSFIQMVTIPFLDDFFNHKKEVKKVILKSNLPYLCIVFTIIYSILYMNFGIGGRGGEDITSGIIYTAIGEVNLSALSLFCLALIVRKKNKYIGNLVFLIGLFTISRMYILSIITIIIFNLKFTKRIINGCLKYLSYFNLTIVSSIVLLALGILFLDLYHSGGILAYNSREGFSRLLHLNDYSNFYRFLAVYLIVMIIIKNTNTLLVGFSDEQFREYGKQITSALNVNFAGGIGTHNLFFAHLKMYGLAVFFEIYYVSKYLRKNITPNNFGIFLAAFLYSAILGTGLNSYWLFLVSIDLIMYEEPRSDFKNE